MKKASFILLMSWVVFRLIFHSFDFSNSNITTFLYFGGNDAFIIGFLSILYSLQRNNNFRVYRLSRKQFKRILITLLIYAGFCLLADILMLLGIGAHDFWLYTALSISIISIGMLWAIYV